MTDLDIETCSGPVRGRIVDGVARFEGIPFAAPATGERRLAPPVPPEPWTEVREAFAPGSTAPQNPSMLEQMLGADDAVIAEDCLSVNVFAPASAFSEPGGVGSADSPPRPVMVWIHGGGFLTGTGSIPWYDGTHLAQRGVVVVTLNYRLGVLGFLHLEEIGPGFEGSGNLGLLDQVAALEWVRDNIAAFGGDPAQVTVFGESAGAMSVGTLLAVPAAEGLFHRAVMQSGAASHVHTAEVATAMARQFLAEVGVPETDLARLRDLPLAEVLAAQARFSATFPFEAGLPLQPVIDGRVLPGNPLERVGAGCAAPVEILVGTNVEEMKMFLLMEPSLADLEEATLSIRADEMMTKEGYKPGDALRVYRADRAEAPLADVLSAVLTDHTFRIPAIRLAEAQLAHNPAVWMYLFGYSSPAFGGALGSCHALEIPFVWDNLDAQGAPMFAGDPTEATRALASAMADAWVAFATDGTPGSASLPQWPRYDADRRATLYLDTDRFEVVDDPHGDERGLWA